MFGALRRSPSAKKPATESEPADGGHSHLDLARESLRQLLDDTRLPKGVRESLASDYAQVGAMLDKLEHGHVHIAVFGRVSTGKSSLLNALIGEPRFGVSPLHGETRISEMEAWHEERAAGVFFVDTPGIDEPGGEEREAMAREVSNRSDLILFVVDADITASEHNALKDLVSQGRPVILVLNKCDRYTGAERDTLLRTLAERTTGLIDPENIVGATADPQAQTVISIDATGDENESQRSSTPEIGALRLRLWEILEREGKTLAALNASMFAADLSDKVGQRILAVRRELGDKLVRTYCLAKGAAVAFNPVPVTDLFAAAFIDIGMVVHLSRIYGLPIARAEAGSLVKVIMAESAALMGTVWAVHFVSSALKVGTGGPIHHSDCRCPGRGRLLQHLCRRSHCGAIPRAGQELGRRRPKKGGQRDFRTAWTGTRCSSRRETRFGRGCAPRRERVRDLRQRRTRSSPNRNDDNQRNHRALPYLIERTFEFSKLPSNSLASLSAHSV